MSADSEPNTKQCPVPVEVPRDPEVYRATVHFGQRLAERVKPAVPDASRVIRECIKYGHCSGASDTNVVEEDGDWIQCFKFEAEVYDLEWTLVVGMTRAGFLDDGKHDAVTIYRSESGDRL